MKTTFLFDLDGTVLESQPGIFAAARYALKEMALPAPDDAHLRPFLGPPLGEGFAEVCHVPADRVEDAIRLYRTYYQAGGMFEAAIYAGMPELLRELHKQGRRCIITTSKPQPFARRILAHFGADTLFDDIFGSELNGGRDKKADVLRYAMAQYAIDPVETVLVGDRCYDVNGAKEVGIACVGVLYGYGEEQELRQAGATWIAKDMSTLKDLLLTL